MLDIPVPNKKDKPNENAKRLNQMITNSNTFQKDPVPPLIKVRDVAKLLSISRTSVHNLIESGALMGKGINPSAKQRCHLRITRKSLLNFYKDRFGHSLVRALSNPFEP
jgi:hypothetical protein